MNEGSWRGYALLVAALLGAMTPMAGRAGEAQDRLFAIGVLEGVETGQRLVYGYDRAVGVASAELPVIEDGKVEMTIVAPETGSREVRVTIFEEARVRRLNPFPEEAGNPLLMVFMETSVRSMAALTGGSPFYIRNRMREALRVQDAGEPVEVVVAGQIYPAERYSFRPFAEDPNRERMGPFADLEISFVISDVVPGTYAAIEAVTGLGPEGKPLLRETMKFEKSEMVN